PRPLTAGTYDALPVDQATAEQIVIDLTDGINDPWDNEPEWVNDPQDWGDPKAPKWKQEVARNVNCPWTSLEYAERFRGRRGPFSQGAPAAPNLCQGKALLETYFGAEFQPATEGSIRAQLQAAGDGAQAVVRVKWQGQNFLHIFNA